MDFNSVSSYTSNSNISASYTKTTNADGSVTETLDFTASKNESSMSASSFSSDAAVLELSSGNSNTSGVYTRDSIRNMSSTDRSALVQQLQADAENLKNSMLDMVRKAIGDQGGIFATASDDDIWHKLASGDFTIDEAAKADAQAAISEDGYWGVDQTSSRIVDFAILLSGDDTSKADTLIEAFKKGYSEATSSWGQDLPDISSQTYDAVMEKFQQWKDGTYTSSAYAE